jgi:hypothetical protein
VLVIGAICLLSLGGLELVERLVPAQTRQKHNDVAGFIYAALGVIYAVLIALVVIAVWEWICPGMVDTFLSRSVLFSQSNLLELSRA